MKGWVGPSWLCEQLTHITGHSSDAGWAQDRESSPAKDRRETRRLRGDVTETFKIITGRENADKHEFLKAVPVYTVWEVICIKFLWERIEQYTN